jgi:hypothetical protein
VTCRAAWGAPLGLVALLLGALFATGCGPAELPLAEESAPAERSYGEPQSLAELENPEIRESSGLAPSRVRPGAFFTHNDSGHPPRLYLFDLTGADLGSFDVVGADNVDWEDLASAELDGIPYLFVGDIGDNRRSRESIVVYRVPEPRIGERLARADETYVLNYPDGPRDAECLLVDPASGDLMIVEKTTRDGAGVYLLPRPRGSGAYVLQRVGEVRIATPIREGAAITAGDVSPDGRFVLLRTYLGGYEYPVEGDFVDWWKGAPTAVPMPPELQGEAVAYALDGRSIFTVPEGRPAVISAVAIR